ncbi:MAG TPA: alpha-1,6-glucosidase domain-containing protein [Usitatibacteraceae bacterium]|nr:alpha-1,6-glucosidase domain-containing protein [Usitatibacteraceae bacterium]
MSPRLPVRATRFLAASIALGLANASFGAPAAGATAVYADCRIEHSRVLQAATTGPALNAEAVWIDATRIRWPAAGPGRTFRLLEADDIESDPSPGSTLAGARVLELLPASSRLDALTTRAIAYLGAGVDLELRDVDRARLRELHKRRVVLVELDNAQRVVRATRVQAARALDALFAESASRTVLGFSREGGLTHFRLWAPTARRVALCLYPSGTADAVQDVQMVEEPASGVWQAALPVGPASRYYAYLVDVWVPGVGLVRNRVTDPYSISLSANSRRSLVATLEDPELMPAGWSRQARRPALASQTDLVAYELHLRDFSMGDASVPAAHRGKYLAFTHATSNGMRHLKMLARAGVTDVHLLPVFDIASIDESQCTTPVIRGGAADTAQRETVARSKAGDCYNWGYDPFHYTAPEGSYATKPDDGPARVREFRQMVMALNRAGLRVGMDVVYNHTAASGQAEKSVLDRIVPGYYHRLNAKGQVEMSTCCDNTATEHRMMEKLMSDSVLAWARHYRIDSFRFDLMGHQPRSAMERLRDRLQRELERDIPLIGEGWNFGEIADGRRFIQASQLSLPGTGIATFSDRARDAARGGGHADSGANLIALQGFLNGLAQDPNAMNAGRDQREALLKSSDLLRVGLLGSIADLPLTDHRGERKLLSAFDYNGRPAGYVAEPGEVVNYVENHDNQTLFDINALRLPRATSREDRARMQVLGGALTAFSQGVAYLHAGIEILRSKSLDRNSFDSGDHFNRIDWTYRGNNFAQGLPPAEGEAARDDPLLAEALNDPRILPTGTEIRWTRDAFLDLLRIRASSTLFRLRSAKDIEQRVTMLNTGPDQVPGLLAAHIDGAGYPGAGYSGLAYFINAAPHAVQVKLPRAGAGRFVLHPLLLRAGAADARVRKLARFDAPTGVFDIPARSAAVFVQR